MPQGLQIALILVGAIILLAAAAFLLSYGMLYIKALLAGAHVGIAEIIGTAGAYLRYYQHKLMRSCVY